MASSNDYLSPSYNILYAEPFEMVTGTVSMVRIQPLSAQTIGPGQNIVLLAQSTNSFLDQHRSYINFDVTVSGEGAGTAGCYLMPTGATGFFQQVLETLGSSTLPVVNDYPLVKAYQNATTSQSRKQMIYKTEGFVDGTVLVNGQSTLVPLAKPGSPVAGNEQGIAFASDGTQTYRFSVPLPSATLSSNQLVPLCFMTAGMKLEITTNILSNIFYANTGGTNATSYTLSNIEMVACMIKPPDQLLVDYSEKLSRGESLYFAMNQIKNFTATLSGSITSVQQPFNISYFKSVNSAIIGYRPTTSSSLYIGTYNTTTTNLSYWNINLNLIQYPSNKNLYAEGNTPTSQETLLQVIRGYNVLNDDLSPYAAAANGHQIIDFRANEHFNSGVPSNNGVCQITETIAASTSGDQITLTIEYCSPLEISAAGTSYSY